MAQMIELKCGKCKTVFPIHAGEYLKRLQSGNDVMHLINCPSCLNQMPFVLQKALKDLVLTMSTETEWEIGTEFNKK